MSKTNSRTELNMVGLGEQEVKPDDLPFEQMLAQSKGIMEKARNDLKAARDPILAPVEDDYGQRMHSAAAAQLTETFGGLVLGFSGSPPGSASEEPNYHGLMFTAGKNLGPEYPGDLKMTPVCRPKDTRTRLRLRDLAGDRPEIQAHFSPVLSADFGKKKKSEPFFSSMDPDAFEFQGEGPYNHYNEEPNMNMLVFFGKSEEIKRNDCPPFFATSDEVVMEYIDAHNIDGLLEYMLTLCSIHFPDNPFDYMARYCGSLVDARLDQTKFSTLKRIFYPKHVSAMYRLFDKTQRRLLTLIQYKQAMEMLGLLRFNPEPEGYIIDAIPETVFLKEANHGLDLLIRSFIV